VTPERLQELRELHKLHAQTDRYGCLDCYEGGECEALAIYDLALEAERLREHMNAIDALKASKNYPGDILEAVWLISDSALAGTEEATP
jgi:hypothetical protein